MKLIVAVVGDEHAAPLTELLTKKGFGATKLASTGGFLKAGNTTFLIGVPSGQLDDAMAAVRAACPPKESAGGVTVQKSNLKTAAGKLPEPLSSAIAVGGATVFILGVEKTVKV